MSKNKVKIKLNSSVIGNFLKNDTGLKKILKESASDVETNLRSTVKNNNALHNRKTKDWQQTENTPEKGGQSFYSEFNNDNDRMKFEVGINKAKYSDFRYNSIPKAVSKSSKGGEK